MGYDGNGEADGMAGQHFPVTQFVCIYLRMVKCCDGKLYNNPLF